MTCSDIHDACCIAPWAAPDSGEGELKLYGSAVEPVGLEYTVVVMTCVIT